MRNHEASSAKIPVIDNIESIRELAAKLQADNAELKQRVQQLSERERHLRAILDSEPECVKSLAADGTLLDHGSVRDWEVEFRRKDGTVGHSLRSLERLTLDGEDCILTTLNDITARNAAEADLRASEERLQLFITHAPAALAMFDRDMRYLAVSRRWINDYGLRDSEIISRSHYDIFPDLPERWKAAHRCGLAGEIERADEDYFERADGSKLYVCWEVRPWTAADGTIGGIVIFTEDITARKLAEIALRERDERHRQLFDFCPDALFIVDATGRCRDVNQTAIARYGYTRDELRQLSPIDLAALEIRDLASERIREAIQHETRFEWRHRRKDGHEFPVEVAAQPLMLGGERCILSCVRDCTDRKAHEVQLAASRERLETLSRQLIATQESERRHLSRELHDEIGQELTSIKLNLKNLQSPSPSDAELVHDTLAVAEHALQQVRSLALDLRPSILDDIGLAAALRWCLDRQAHRAGFHAQFFAMPPEIATTPEIAITCFRVVQECLTNIARHAHARNVRVEVHQYETALDLQVQDDGIGFDVQAATERATRGASLGLLGMRERAELVGGLIDIESTPGSGTTIHARFPNTRPEQQTTGSM